MMTPKELFTRLKNGSFRKEQSGGVTMEFVLWAPIFVALIAGAVDISLAFMNQSNFWNVARDTARLVARHALTVDQAKTYAEQNATFGDASPTATVTIVNGDEVLVSISAPAVTMDAFGLFGIFDGTTIKAEVLHTLEPR